MKAEDIVKLLAVRLPLVSSDFTNNLTVNSITRTGTDATVSTDTAHGLSVGDKIFIDGAETPIIISSLTRSGSIGTLTTTQPHDITYGSTPVVKINGATEVEFNGSFNIISVPNRNTITFSIDDSGPTVATGSPLLINGSSYLQQYNGLKEVTAVPTTTTFQYTVSSTLYTPASGNIVAKLSPRISAALTLERIIDSYTSQAINDAWAFVVLDDVTASRSRHIDSDAVDNLQRGNEFRQQVIQPFSVFVFIPTSNQLSARQARDSMSDIFVQLCKSLLGAKIDSGLFVGASSPVQFVGHGFAVYNTAYYAHQFDFQQVTEITFSDTIGYNDDVAFRDIAMVFNTDVGTEQFTADINLDG